MDVIDRNWRAVRRPARTFSKNVTIRDLGQGSRVSVDLNNHRDC